MTPLNPFSLYFYLVGCFVLSFFLQVCIVIIYFILILYFPEVLFTRYNKNLYI